MHAKTTPLGTFRADVDETGEAFIPDAFASDFRALTAALDWARVYAARRDHYAAGQELAAAKRHAESIAAQCHDFAQMCHELER